MVKSMFDHRSVSDWAVSSVGWCFKNKVLFGSNGEVSPKGNASRAEAAKTAVGLYDLLVHGSRLEAHVGVVAPVAPIPVVVSNDGVEREYVLCKPLMCTAGVL